MCDTCWFYACSSDILVTHQATAHTIQGCLCEWPGYRVFLNDNDEPQRHIQQIRELKTWISAESGCHERFFLEKKTQTHTNTEYFDITINKPRMREKEYRPFDLTLLRSERKKWETMWRIQHGQGLAAWQRSIDDGLVSKQYNTQYWLITV